MRAIQTHDFDKEVLARKSPVAVLFEADWCPFCTSFSSIVKRREDEILLPIVAVLLNAYDDPLWDRYSIEVVPTLAVFEDGELMFRIDGILGTGLKDADISRLVEYIIARTHHE